MHTRKGALSAENLGDMASHKAESSSLPDQWSSGVSTALPNAKIRLSSRQSDKDDAIPKSGTHMTIATTSNEDHERHPPLQHLSITSQGLWSFEATSHPRSPPSDRDNFASITDFEYPVLQELPITARKDGEIQPSLEKQTLERSSNVTPHVCSSCSKHYARKGDLTRHITTAHRRPASFLCHFRHCPRSIEGKGFHRRDKLVDHLMSTKHRLSKVEAVYEAKKSNTN